jgi:hypothetical protein
VAFRHSESGLNSARGFVSPPPKRRRAGSAALRGECASGGWIGAPIRVSPVPHWFFA